MPKQNYFCCFKSENTGKRNESTWLKTVTRTPETTRKNIEENTILSAKLEEYVWSLYLNLKTTFSSHTTNSKIIENDLKPVKKMP